MDRTLYPIYAMHSLQGLAGSLVGVFVPIYLLKLGNSLTDVFIFYLSYSVFSFLSFLLANHVSKWLSLRKIILLSYVFLFVYIMFLILLERANFPLIILAFLYGMYTAFYWFSLHNLFAERSEDETIGRSVGKLFVFPKLAALLAPLIGGGIAVLFGFNSLIASGAVLYFISLTPLFLVKEFPRPQAFRFSKFKEFIKKYPRYFVVEFADIVRSETENIIWPIFIFLIFRNVLSVGSVGSLSAAGAALFAMAVGSYSDRINKAFIMKVGAVAMLAIWIIRFLTESEPLFYALTLLAGFFAALIFIPFNSIIYTLARENNIREFIVFREIPVTLARLSVYSLAILFVLNIKLSFLVAATSTLIYFFYRK